MSDTTREAEYIAELVEGSSLLKARKTGNPHFRFFSLSQDLTRLSWSTASNKAAEKTIRLSEITELKYGQVTPVFQKSKLPEYEAFSFSAMYSDKSLDIVCANREEFDVWTTALQALLKGYGDVEAVKTAGTRASRSVPSTLVMEKSGIKTKLSVKQNACDMYSCGGGYRGMLGHGEEEMERIPRVINALLGRNIIYIVCGIAHTIALSDSGEVFSWGSGRYGRLGQGHLRDRFSPLMIDAPLRGLDVVQVACHEFHSAALCDTGELYTWGKAGPHLGYSVPANKQLEPRLVDQLKGKMIKHVGCGYLHTIVCSDTGSVFAFGQNKYGQLGLGKSPAATMPTEVSGISDACKVCCGRYHSAALMSSGKLFMWGWGERGQLAQGDQNNRHTPSVVKPLEDEHVISDVSCGDGHTVTLTANGIVFCWGDNTAGQLGLNSNLQEISLPKAVVTPPGANITMVACGANFTAALAVSGKVYTWGLGSTGQLGHGDIKNRSSPTEVEALADKHVKLIACGSDHMCSTVIHSWVPDKEAESCMACNREFTFAKRRHHCRRCGGVYCGACTTKRYPLLSLGFSDPVRVCDKCYSTLNALNK